MPENKQCVMLCTPEVFTQMRQAMPMRKWPMESRSVVGDFRVRMNYMPVLTSPYVMMGCAGDPEPSIIHEFAEWFAWAVRKHTKV